MKKQTNKKPKTNVFIFLLILTMIIFGILLICMNEVLFKDNNRTTTGLPGVKMDKNSENKFEAYFPGCKILENNCVDSKCDKFFLCNDKEYLTCEIYDCVQDYGIGTMDVEENIKIGKKIKYDRELAEKMIEKCRGDIELKDSNCIKDKLELKIKVSTQGECVIRSFKTAYKDENDPESMRYVNADSFTLENDLYLVTFDSCGEYLKIIAVGGGGVSINEKSQE